MSTLSGQSELGADLLVRPAEAMYRGQDQPGPPVQRGVVPTALDVDLVRHPRAGLGRVRTRTWHVRVGPVLVVDDPLVVHGLDQLRRQHPVIGATAGQRGRLDAPKGVL